MDGTPTRWTSTSKAVLAVLRSVGAVAEVQRSGALDPATFTSGDDYVEVSGGGGGGGAGGRGGGTLTWAWALAAGAGGL